MTMICFILFYPEKQATIPVVPDTFSWSFTSQWYPLHITVIASCKHSPTRIGYFFSRHERNSNIVFIVAYCLLWRIEKMASNTHISEGDCQVW